MMSTELVSVLSRAVDRSTTSRTRRNSGSQTPIELTEVDGTDASGVSRLSPDLSLDGPMPVFRRRGYYLDFFI
ncbi:hypothetical protein [Acetobacter sp.]|uniref:hypothetical protein n=1 Tax=Acetobacter sp. TaxID=440 RepID=UPI0039ED8B03